MLLFQIIFFVTFAAYGSNGLQWSTAKETKSTNDEFYFDAATENQAIMEVNGYTSLVIRARLRGDNGEKLKFSLCKLGHFVCVELSESIKDIFNMTLNEFEFTQSPTGMTARLYLESNSRVNLGGLYAVHVTNADNRVLIRSNVLEIRDLYYWSLQHSTPTQRILPHAPKRLVYPLVLSCQSDASPMPVWIRQYNTPIQWKFCHRKSFAKSKTNCDSRRIKHIVDYAGNLILESNNDIDDDTVIFCHSKQLTSLIHVYTDQPFALYKSTPYKFNNTAISLAKIHPIENVDLTLLTGKYQRNIVLYALYRSIQDVQLQWTKNGASFTNAANNLTLPAFINFNTSGVYQLNVDDKRSALTFRYNITVKSYPQFTANDCLPAVMYVLEHDNVQLTCVYIADPITMAVSINDHDLVMTAGKKLPLYLTKYYPKLALLKSQLVRTNNRLQYSVSAIQAHQDHVIVFHARNEHGEQIRASRIVVLPRINYTAVTAVRLSLLSTRFTCNLPTPLYDQQKAVVVEVLWTYNGKKITNTTSDYLTLKHNNTTLLFDLDPQAAVTKAESARDQFDKAIIVCNVRLWRNDNRSDLIYDSLHDPTISALMTSSLIVNIDSYYVNYIMVTMWVILAVSLLLIGILVFCVVQLYCWHPQKNYFNFQVPENERMMT